MQRPKTILWVDDEVEGLAAHRRFLEAQGFTVAAAGAPSRLAVSPSGGRPPRDARLERVAGAGRRAGALGGTAGRVQRAGALGGVAHAPALPPQGLRRVRGPPVSALARQPRGRP